MMITADLRGRAVLVTGGASGIGLAAVELFARCGARVAMNHLADDARAPAEIARLVDEKLDVISAPGDVAAPGSAERMVKGAIDKLGRLDVLINNAGTSATVEPIEFADLDAMTESFWQKILMTNLVGPFRCAHAAAPALKASGGAIVNTASVAGLGVRGSSIAYGASKAGLVNEESRARARAGGARQRGRAGPGRFAVDQAMAGGEEARHRRADAARPHGDARRHRRDHALFLAAGAAYITGETIAVAGGLN